MPRPERVVDAHVHHWDPQRTDRYPFLAADDALAGLGLSDVSRMRRRFDQATYLAEADGWHVEKYVHVTAALGNLAGETRELGRLATESGHPDAVVAGIDADRPVEEVLASVAEQAEVAPCRGFRASAGLDPASDTGRRVLTELRDRDLVFDLVVHPEGMATAATALAEIDGLTVVVEHTGWPLTTSDEHAALWREGMTRLAAVGDRVQCKLSGLAMTLQRIDVEAFRPWVSHCLEVFGVNRCFFASNFPVDGLFGTFDELYSVYDELVAHLSPAVRARLFADNAERVYRC
jgi:predicted TIM-barrel fold metal-dependent hydrolase